MSPGGVDTGDQPDHFAHLQLVLAESKELAQRFVDAGYKVYLVGGIVRDLWLNRPVGDDLDLDLTTDATPEVIKDLLGDHVDALWTQGERFGTIGAQVAGRSYEITTHRSESYVTNSRKPKVTFSTAVEEDLSRRDFTVNAMALSLPDATLIDPHDGAADLAASVLRTPLTPEMSFNDDPLRMLRAARFAAGYQLAPVPVLVQAMRDLAPRLDIVSAERVRDELDKLLRVAKPDLGLSLLLHTGLLVRFLPEVAALEPAQQVPLYNLVDQAARDPKVRLALLFAGAHMDDPSARMRELKYSTERTQWTRLVTRAARQVLDYQVVTDPDVRRWWSDAKGRAPEGLELARLMAQGKDGNPNAVQLVEERAKALSEDLSDLSVPLTGDQVMAQLGCEPGRTVGAALAHLADLRFNDGPLTSAQAKAALATWWSTWNSTGSSE